MAARAASPTALAEGSGGIRWRPALVVFFTVVLDLVGFGIVIPLMTYYAEKFDATPLQVTLLMACYSLAQFFAAPIWGQMSDRYGRRPVMLVSVALTAVMLALFASAQALWMLFLFRTLHGVMTANISIAQACMADVTTPASRAKGMGLIGAAFGLGFTIGPFIGGELSQVGVDGQSVGMLLSPILHAAAAAGPAAVQEAAATCAAVSHSAHDVNLTAPLWFAAGLSVLNFFLAVAFLPETRHPGSAPAHRRISATALLDTLRNPALGLAVLLVFVAVFSFSLMESTFTLFAEHVHCLQAKDVGRLFGSIGIVGIVVQGGLIGRLVKRFGERPLVPIGLACTAIGILAMPFVPMGGAMYADFALIALGQGLYNPPLQGLISKAAAASEQGSVLGSSQSMSALARAAGPAMGGVLYSLGAPVPFIASGLLLAFGVGLAVPAAARAMKAAGG